MKQFIIDLTEYIMYWLDRAGEPSCWIFLGVIISEFLLK